MDFTLDVWKEQAGAQLLVGQLPEPRLRLEWRGRLRLLGVHVDGDRQPGEIELLGPGHQVGKVGHRPDLSRQLGENRQAGELAGPVSQRPRRPLGGGVLGLLVLHRR